MQNTLFCSSSPKTPSFLQKLRRLCQFCKIDAGTLSVSVAVVQQKKIIFGVIPCKTSRKMGKYHRTSPRRLADLKFGQNLKSQRGLEVVRTWFGVVRGQNSALLDVVRDCFRT